MNNPQLKMNAEQAQAETVEVKRPAEYYDVDDSLSEWERARMTSKTWSMEQE